MATMNSGMRDPPMTREGELHLMTCAGMMPCEALLLPAAADGGPWQRDSPTGGRGDGEHGVRRRDDGLPRSRTGGGSGHGLSGFEPCHTAAGDGSPRVTAKIDTS